MKICRASIALSALAVILPLGSSGALAEANHRSGQLHVTKECSQYVNEPGGFCTILTSNVSVIKPGTKVIYADIADATGAMNVDITLSTGHGPVGYGHVTLAAPGDHGTVTIDGGTGRYRHFHATAAVTCPDICYWNGTYRFDIDEHD